MYTITVPDNDRAALRAAAEFFARLCDCVVEPRPRVGVLVTGDTSELKAALDEIKTFDLQKSKIIIRGIARDEEFLNGGPIPDSDFTEAVPPPDTVMDSEGNKFITVPPPPVQTDDPGTVFSTSPASPLINVPSTIDGVPQPPSPETPPMVVATDINGLPWDARIHASSKNTIANGSWRIRKQPADMNKEQWDAYIGQVTNELKGAMAVPTPPPPAAGDTTIKTRDALLKAILDAGIEPVRTQEACAKFGISGFPLLGSRPDLIPLVAEELELK